MKVDVIIIGAGLAGLTTAYALLRRGKRVRILEANRVEASASAGLVGALAPHMPEHWNAKKAYQFQSLQMAAEFWPMIEREANLPTGYARKGRMQAVWNARDLEKARMREAEARRSWQGLAHWVVDENHAHPFLNSPAGIIKDDLSAQIFPQLSVIALAQYLRNNGVDIRENTPVTYFEKGRVEADETHPCEQVVIAGGYDAWPFLRPYFGAEFGEGTKGQALLLKLEKDWEFPMVTGDGYYVVPHEKRLLGIGSTSERYWTNRAVDEQLDGLLERVNQELNLPQFEVIRTWCGIRPRAYRPDPLVGEIAPNIYVNAGGFKTGFSFANKLAEDLADVMNGGDPAWPATFDAKNHLKSF